MTAQRQELTGALPVGCYGHGKLAAAREGRGKRREAHSRLRWAVQRRREADSRETNRWWHPLADKELGTKRNDEECGKGLWGRRGWCATPFIGSRW
jgi:hypothetical protein